MENRHKKIFAAIVVLLFLGILISLVAHAMIGARAVLPKKEIHPDYDLFPKDKSYDFPKDWSSVLPKAMPFVSVASIAPTG